MGYPDFQAYANAVGAPIANVSNQNIVTGVPFTAAGYVSNYASSRLKISPNRLSDGLAVTLAWFDAAAMAHQLGSFSWTVVNPAVLVVIVPNLGPYAQLTVASFNANGTPTDVFLQPQVTACPSPRYMASGNEAFALNQAVPASATFQLTLPQVAEGPGHWTLYPRDTAAKLSAAVWVLGHTGALVEKVDEVDAIVPTAAVNRPLYGSTSTLALQVVNADAAGAHSFDARLIIDGR